MTPPTQVTGTADPGTQAPAHQRFGKSPPFYPPSPGSAPQGLPAPNHLHPQILSSSRNPDASSLGPGTLSSGGDHVWVAALPPTVDSLPLPESGELPEEDSETDLSPRLPAAHLIGKDPISLVRTSRT